jgi:hypothetical protein
VTSGSLPQLNIKSRVKTQQASRKVDKKVSLTETIKTQQERSVGRILVDDSEKVDA